MPHIPINQPTLPRYETLMPYLKSIFKSKSLTNNHFTALLEERAKKYLGVREVVAVSSATSGLMLLPPALGLTGEVLVPSFTFPATAHAVVWNDLKPVFVDCDPYTFNLDFIDLEKKITKRTSAVLGVHVFGNPLDMVLLQRVGKKHGIRILVDGAHALGAEINSRSVACFGDATVFSLAPTKLVTSAEGGLIATNNIQLARKLRLLRNYGNPPDYNCRYIGLNARLSEIHAALGIECFKKLDAFISIRNNLVSLYRLRLKRIPGIYFQKIAGNALSPYNYFAMVIEGNLFGMNSVSLKEKLAAHGIQTRRYFYPPVHCQDAYKTVAHGLRLPKTEQLADTILCLPLYSHIEKKTIVFICDIIEKAYEQNHKEKRVK